MTGYLDASALVKRYVDEEGSEHVAGWLDRPSATSRWTQVEILSAVARRWREGFLTDEDRDGIAGALADDLTGLYVVEVTADVIAIARRLLARHALRAGDAVQLASAQLIWQRTGDPVRFCSFDVRLNAAAAAEGLTVATS